MKSVHLIPEIKLLIIFDSVTTETDSILLPASQIRALAEEFEDAVLHLDARPLFVVEPETETEPV